MYFTIKLEGSPSAETHYWTASVFFVVLKSTSGQGRPWADAAALGPAPWWLGRLFIFPDTPCAQELWKAL